jgi:phage tail tape-measure protein
MNAKQMIRCAGAVSLALALSTAYAADNDTHARPMTGKEKATAIGAGTGAVAGAVVGGPVGAVVGGVAGGVIGHEGTDARGRVNANDTRTSDSRMSSPSTASDSSVLNAQNALNSQGYDAGTADGRMGPTTRAAITKYQADHNLPQTGMLDPATQASLNGTK